MAYKDGFVIEYVDDPNRKVSCSKCIHFNPREFHCTKKDARLADIGFDSWRRCPTFELDEDCRTARNLAQVAQRDCSLGKLSKDSYKKALHDLHMDEPSRKRRKKPYDDLEIGCRVFNKRHGAGKITSKRGDLITVTFKNGGKASYYATKAFSNGDLRLFKADKADESAYHYENTDSFVEKKKHRGNYPARRTSSIPVGTVFDHSKYGRGKVIEIKGDVAIVKFDGGKKKLSAEFISNHMKDMQANMKPVQEKTSWGSLGSRLDERTIEKLKKLGSK